MFKIAVMNGKDTIIKVGKQRFAAITKDVQTLAKQVAMRNKGYYTRIIPAQSGISFTLILDKRLRLKFGAVQIKAFTVQFDKPFSKFNLIY